MGITFGSISTGMAFKAMGLDEIFQEVKKDKEEMSRS